MNGAGEWIHDRFTVCLVLAIGLHAAVVFGVSFGIKLDTPPNIVETLDVMLVNWRSEEEPEEPDYLAQAAQRGGGEEDENERPAQPLSGWFPNPNLGEDVMQAEEATPEEQVMEREVLATKAESETVVEQTLVETPEPEQPTAAALRREAMEMASLQPNMSRHDQQRRSSMVRREFISANTRQYEFASYMSGWVAKVERVGNLNYPTELRNKRLHGDLVLTVGIRHDGSVEGIQVNRSSGQREIDRAAMEIVRLASPYAPLPDNIRERVDVLHITRTWRFESAFGVD